MGRGHDHKQYFIINKDGERRFLSPSFVDLFSRTDKEEKQVDGTGKKLYHISWGGRTVQRRGKMQTNEIVLLIVSMAVCFFWWQVEASGCIGNRPYSAWYETHFLAEKRGICSLIYYKPKHFGRYTLYEALCFFLSFLQLFVQGIMALFLGLDMIPSAAFLAVCLGMMGAAVLVGLAIVILNDIGSHLDEKKKFYLERGEREILKNAEELPRALAAGRQGKLLAKIMQVRREKTNNGYFTIYNLRDSYIAELEHAKKSAKKTEEVNRRYIEYFKNIEDFVVVREKENGVLVFKNETLMQDIPSCK